MSIDFKDYISVDVEKQLDSFDEILAQPNTIKINFYKGKNYNLTPLAQLPNLKAIWFAEKSTPASFASLKDISTLVSLRLNNQFELLKGIPLSLLYLSVNGTKVSDFSWLAPTDTLKWFSASYNWNVIDDQAVLPNLPNLQVLELLSRKLTTLANLHLPPKLESIYVASNKNLKDLNGIENCTQLKQLDIFKTAVSSLANVPTDLLTHLTAASSKIKTLKDWKAPNLLEANFNKTPLKTLEGIHNSTQLKRLDLGATKIKELASLEELRDLQYLSLAKCTNIKDFSALFNCTQLEALDLSNTSISVEDAKKLLENTALKRINLSNTEAANLTSSKKWVVTNNHWSDVATYSHHDPFHYTGIELPSRMFYPLDRLTLLKWI